MKRETTVEVTEVLRFISLEPLVTYLTSKYFHVSFFFSGFKSEKISDVISLWVGKERFKINK